MKNYLMNQWSKFCLCSLLLALLMASSCKKYLEVKPDGKLAVPQTIQDLQAILDANTMSSSYPAAGDICSDYFYLPYASWQSVSLIDSRNDYIWDAHAAN